MRMRQKQNGTISIVYLPGVGSLVARSFQMYQQMFTQLCGLTAIFAISGIANLFITGFLGSLSEGKPQFIAASVTLVNLALFFAFGYLYTFLFAATAHIIHEWYSRGRSLTIQQGFDLARERFSSLYWVGMLLFLMLYGSGFTGFLPIVFSIWYYFAVYIVLFESEKGTESLAKSRYLLHGLFIKVFGRYVAIIAAYVSIFFLLYLLFSGLPGGWIFMLMLMLVLGFFSFPFFVAYGYLQYHDTSSVDRSTAFSFFRGERATIVAWSILGLFVMLIGLFLSLLSDDTLKRLGKNISVRVIQVLLPLASNSEQNQEKISDFLEKLNREKSSEIKNQAPMPQDYYPNKQGY